MRQDEKYCCGAIFSLFCRKLNLTEIIFLWRKRIWELIRESSAGAATSTYQQTVCTPPFRERKIVAIVFFIPSSCPSSSILTSAWLVDCYSERSMQQCGHVSSQSRSPTQYHTRKTERLSEMRYKDCSAAMCTGPKKHSEDTLFKSYHSN